MPVRLWKFSEKYEKPADAGSHDMEHVSYGVNRPS
ncbi:UNVERIFIED_ORG: hypothetical protein OKW25_002576 [Pseudomonas vranovensis]|nr:hypothetical protein [Pseudomonas vranovensis]